MITKNNVTEKFYELGRSKIFLIAIILNLISIPLSALNICTSLLSCANEYIATRGTDVYYTDLIYEISALAVSLLSGICLLRLYLSFKNKAPNANLLRRLFIYEIIVNALSFIYHLSPLVTRRGESEYSLFFAIWPYLMLSVLAIGLIILLLERKTIKLAVALIEHDVNSIIKYKASNALVVFLVFSYFFTLVRLDFPMALPGFAAYSLFIYVLISFCAISHKIHK